MSALPLVTLGYEAADAFASIQRTGWSRDDALELEYLSLDPPGLRVLDGLRGLGIARPSLNPMVGPKPARVVLVGEDRFEFSDTGTMMLVVPVIQFGQFVDMVAFLPRRPAQICRLTGAGWALGADNILSPYTFGSADPVRVFTTVVDWLRADGRGVVILDPAAARAHLPIFAGRSLLAESPQAARDLRRALTPAPLLIPNILISTAPEALAA